LETMAAGGTWVVLAAQQPARLRQVHNICGTLLRIPIWRRSKLTRSP
jgi:hypothetical protein